MRRAGVRGVRRSRISHLRATLPRLALLAGAGAPVVLGGAAPLAAQAEERCRILGTVVDADLGEPVAGASVWLEPLDGGPVLLAARTTTAEGTFLFELETCRPARIRVRMIGFGEPEGDLEIDGTPGDQEVTIRIPRRPLEVEELRVEVARSQRLRDVGFYARKAWEESTGRDYGEFYEEDDVTGRARAYHDVTTVALSSRIHFLYRAGPLCRGPSFYIDGRRFPERRNFTGWIDQRIKPSEVEGMEIYRPLSSAVPMEFRDYNSSRCGAVAIWTKRGVADPPQIEVELCVPADAGGAVTLEGTVSDALTGVRLPAAYVTLATDPPVADPSGSGGLRAVADADGRFRFCDLEVTPVSLEASYGPVSGPLVPIERAASDPAAAEANPGAPGAGPAIRLDLQVPVTAPGTLVGRLVLAGDLAWSDDLEVVLEGTAWRARPDSTGAVRFEEVPPGDYELAVLRGGETALVRPVSVRSGEVEEVTLEIER